MKCIVCNKNMLKGYRGNIFPPYNVLFIANYCDCGFSYKQDVLFNRVIQYSFPSSDEFEIFAYRNLGNGGGQTFLVYKKYTDLISLPRYIEPNNYNKLEDYKEIINRLRKLVVFS